MTTEEILNDICKYLDAEHGDLVHVQIYGVPEWFWRAISRWVQSKSPSVTNSHFPGGGWMVLFQVPNRACEKMSVTRAAFFRNEDGKPEKTGEIILRDGSENYPVSRWTPPNAGRPEAD